MAARVNLNIPQGSTWSQSIQWKVGDPAEPVDLLGYSARLQIRPSRNSSTIVAEISTPDNGIVITPLDGLFTLSLDAADTAAIAGGQYDYDLEAVSTDGEVTRVCGGNVIINAEVTR